MYSFYGGKQGKTYNIVKRFDEIYLDTTDSNLYPDFNPQDTMHTYTSGECFKYNNGIYMILPCDDNEGVIITMPDDIGTKVVQLQGMVNEFQKGGSYTEVNYGQYVIIDTILNQNHRSDDINGILYRRGFDYTENATVFSRPIKDTKEERTFSITYIDSQSSQQVTKSSTLEVDKYKIYTINVDPETGQPILDNDELTLNETGFDYERWNADWRAYVETPGGGAIYVGQITGPQGDSPKLYLREWEVFQSDSKYEPHGTLTFADYPGMQIIESQESGVPSTVSYNDFVEAGYYNLYDKDGNSTGAVLSFKMPRAAFRLTGQSISPYGEDNVIHTNIEGQQNIVNYTGTYSSESNQIEYDSLIHRHVPDTIHPFYEDWQIAIPKGIKGDSIETIGITGEEGSRVFYWQKRNYDQSAEGTASSYQIGDYKVINDITPVYPDDDDTKAISSLEISYTNGSPTTVALKQINNINSVSNSQGDFNNYVLTANYSVGTNGNSVNTTVEQPVGTINIDTIQEMALIGDRFLIRYSNINHDYSNPSYGTTTTYDNKQWIQLGSYGSSYKVHTTFNSPAAWSAASTTSDYINGIAGAHAGWTIAVVQDQSTSYLYAYDYANSTWKKVFTFVSETDSSHFVQILKEEDIDGDSDTSQTLTTNGLLFITTSGHHPASNS